MFTFKASHALTEADLNQYKVWVALYEPDEFEMLDELDLNPTQVKDFLRTAESSSEWLLGLPAKAASLPFKHKYLSASIRLGFDLVLPGYRTASSLALLHNGAWYRFNQALPDISRSQAAALRVALNRELPTHLEVELPALSRVESYALP